MKSLDVMFSKNGLYVICTQGTIAVCEVENRRVYQCRLDAPYARDDELAPGGWYPLAIVGILGPFFRTPTEQADGEDAARYRWLNGPDSDWGPFDSAWLSRNNLYGQDPADMDAFIDAARASQAQRAQS